MQSIISYQKELPANLFKIYIIYFSQHCNRKDSYLTTHLHSLNYKFKSLIVNNQKFFECTFILIIFFLRILHHFDYLYKQEGVNSIYFNQQ